MEQLNQGRIAKMAKLEEEIKLQESVEPMLKVGKDVFEILRVCNFVMIKLIEISWLSVVNLSSMQNIVHSQRFTGFAYHNKIALTYFWKVPWL